MLNNELIINYINNADILKIFFILSVFFIKLLHIVKMVIKNHIIKIGVYEKDLCWHFGLWQFGQGS